MSPEDIVRCQHAIDLANSGLLQQAYEQFCVLHNKNRDNAEDVTLLFWLAYTTPTLIEAQRALETIERIDPYHPRLPILRRRVDNWQQKDMLASFGKVGPVMTCQHCHHTGPTRYGRRVAIAGWIWFGVGFAVFLCLLAESISMAYTVVPYMLLEQMRQAVSNMEGWAVFALLLSFVGFFFKKRTYCCGYCGIKLGDIA